MAFAPSRVPLPPVGYLRCHKLVKQDVYFFRRHCLVTGWLLAPDGSSSALCQVLFLVLAGYRNHPRHWQPVRGVGFVTDNLTMRHVALGYMLLVAVPKD